MVPEPTANPHAQLVIECFQEGPAPEIPAPGWSPIAAPDSKLVKESGWIGFTEPAVGGVKEDHNQDGEGVGSLFDQGCAESNMPPISGDCLARCAGHGEDDVFGQGSRTVPFENTTKWWDSTEGCTLPSLKELGLDIYVKMRKSNRPWSAAICSTHG